jgi:subtilisin family serine protease
MTGSAVLCRGTRTLTMRNLRNTRQKPRFGVRAGDFEALESRRLLSGGAPDNPVVSMDWHGRRVKAEAGEYILALSPTARLVHGRSADVQVAGLRRALSGRAGAEGFAVEEYLGRPGQFLLDVPQGRGYDDVLAAVKALKGFEYVEPNFVLQLQATTPNDPLFGYEYALNNTGSTPLGPSKADADIDAPEAWDVTTGSPDVVVGVVDTGVDYTHPDLAANMWHNPGEVPGDGIDNDADGYVDDVYGINAAANNGNPMDDYGHGTHVAGTIAAVGNNGVGVTGVAWNAKVMALKFIGADGTGSTADAIECLNYAVTMRNRGVNIRLTSNSWGGGGFETALRDAIARTNTAGMLFVAAAGNGGADGVGDNNDVVPDYPDGYNVPNVLSVAAPDRCDHLATFSNYGATTVDLAAPGVDVASTARGGGYVYMSGTSMATPQVSGVAALAFSLKPAATVADVRNALLSGVDPVAGLAGRVATGGRLNALGTLRALTNSVSGVVYEDSDGNGSRGAAEAPLAGRTVWLDLDGDQTPDAGEPTRTTDAAGGYRFAGLRAGTYAVRQVVPSGWVGTAPAAYTVQIADGQEVADRDFGSRPVPVNPPTATLTEAPTVTSAYAGGTYYYFKVTYADDVAVDYRTIDGGDVLVTGPGGYSQPGTLVNLPATADVKVWTATYMIAAPGGTWDGPDSGTYTVTLQPGQVSDTAGNSAPAAALGTFVVNLADTAPPSAALTSAPAVSVPGGTYYYFTVTYTDDVAVDYRTLLAGNDVLVTGPGGYSQLGTLVNLPATADVKVWTATYMIAAPGGTWDGADSGTYTVSLRPNEVSDTAGNSAPAATLGTFAVNLADTAPPTATLTEAPTVTSVYAGGIYYYFKLRYADDVAVDYRTIGGGDVLVTGPGGYSQPGTLANLVTEGGAWAATYYVTAPGGTWDAADSGTYTITLPAGQVSDAAGNSVPAGPIGTFAVQIAQAAGQDIGISTAGGANLFPEPTIGRRRGSTPLPPVREAQSLL